MFVNRGPGQHLLLIVSLVDHPSRLINDSLLSRCLTTIHRSSLIVRHLDQADAFWRTHAQIIVTPVIVHEGI